MAEEIVSPVNSEDGKPVEPYTLIIGGQLLPRLRRRTRIPNKTNSQEANMAISINRNANGQEKHATGIAAACMRAYDIGVDTGMLPDSHDTDIDNTARTITVTEWHGTIWKETALKAVNRQEWDMLKNAYAEGLAYGSIRNDKDEDD